MKTVLVIDHDIEELEALMDICRLGLEKFTILSSQDEKCANNNLSQKRIDVVVCSSHFPGMEEWELISRLTKRFSFIPFIGVAATGTIAEQTAKSIGISCLFTRPVDSGELIRQIEELSELSSTGTVKDIPVHSFLQMFESEEKSCTLQVFGSNDIGFIYIDDGRVVDAETTNSTGEQAIYDIVSWDNAIIEIKYFNRCRQRSINKPLISLIMEGFRLKDEKESRKQQEQTIVKPEHNLKQVSTAGQRLALDIGLNLKMEFDSVDSALESVLVGLVPESCIITTTPSHFIINRFDDLAGTVALIKFMYLGKLCLFKSSITRAITSPQHMLFFDYPAIIHYHEMRKAKRTTIFIPCILDLPDGGRYFGSFIDLSCLGGLCQIKAKGNSKIPEVGINQPVNISCILPGISEEQRIKGICRNTKTNNQEIRLGIEFEALHSYLQKTISNYLYTIEKTEIFSPPEEFID